MVVALFYRAIEYQRLYRHEIGDGLVLAWEVENHLTIHNSVRPHEAISFTAPLARYLQAPSTLPEASLQMPATVSDS